MPTTSPHLVELTEQVGDWKLSDLRVDRERRLVRNVALTAVESRNGYRYSEQALREALPLYDGKPVFLDHAVNVSRPYDRSARDLVGSIVNPRFEDGRVRGDIRVLDTDAGRTFLGLVESDSPAVGMSHVVLAERAADGGTVERLHDVISVDAVVFPATAATFRESAAEVESVTPEARATGGSPASADQTRRANELSPSPTDESGTSDTELLETDRCEEAEFLAERDRLRAARDELAHDVESLRRELEQLRHEHDRVRQDVEIDRLLADSELPPAVITEVFRRQLRTEQDHAVRQALVAERRSLVRQLAGPQPHSRERTDDPTAGLSDTTFIRAVRRRH
jgi:hypothetical protein